MKEHGKIQATVNSVVAGITSGDVDGVMSAYEPGAVVLGQPGKPVQGNSALREMYAQFIALKPKFTFTKEEIVQTGDIALHYNTWKLEGKLPDGTPVAQGGLSVVVLRKQKDGNWLIVIDDPFGDRLLHQ